MRLDPRRHVAAVGAAARRHAVLVHEPARDQQIGGAHHVLVGAVAPRALDALREVLAPRGRALEVHERSDVARGREQLRVPARMELVAGDAVRPAVDHL